MILPDVNVFVYAHRKDAPRHDDYRGWLDATLAGPEPFALAGVVLAGFVRVVTNPRVYADPTSPAMAADYVELLLQHPGARVLPSSPRHLQVFARLCREANAKGGLVADAYVAALAIDQGCEVITTDRDFARFKGLRWRHPLDD